MSNMVRVPRDDDKDWSIARYLVHPAVKDLVEFESVMQDRPYVEHMLTGMLLAEAGWLNPDGQGAIWLHDSVRNPETGNMVEMSMWHAKVIQGGRDFELKRNAKRQAEKDKREAERKRNERNQKRRQARAAKAEAEAARHAAQVAKRGTKPGKGTAARPPTGE